jgi:WD40 repeat protein
MLHNCTGEFMCVDSLAALLRPSATGPPQACVVLCVGYAGILETWDTNLGEHLHSLGHTCAITCLATYTLPPEDRPRIASTDEKGNLRLWDGEDGRLVADQIAHPYHHCNDLGVYYEPTEGRPRLVTGCSAGEVKVWDGESGEVLRALGVPDAVRKLGAHVSSDGRQWLATGGNEGGIWLHDLDSGEQVHALQGCHTDRITALAWFEPSWAPGQCILVSASWDHMAKVWDAETGRLLHSLTGHTHDVESLALYKEPVGGRDRIVTGSRDKSIKIWDAETGVLLRTLKGSYGAIISLAIYQPPGRGHRLLAGSGPDGDVQVWDPEEGLLVHRRPIVVDELPEHVGGIERLLVFEAEEEGGGVRYRLATGHENGKMVVWDLAEAPAREDRSLRAANKTG